MPFRFNDFLSHVKERIKRKSHREAMAELLDLMAERMTDDQLKRDPRDQDWEEVEALTAGALLLDPEIYSRRGI